MASVRIMVGVPCLHLKDRLIQAGVEMKTNQTALQSLH